MKSFLSVFVFMISGYSSSWSHAPDAYAQAPFDVTIVPGCPSEPDGTVSECQWKRAIWGAALYHGGSTRKLLASGAAVYTPHVEAEALAAGFRALGVPEEDILLETKARHTDENASFSVDLAHAHGYDRIAVASVGAHAVLMDEMLARWGVEVTALPMDRGFVRDALASVPTDLRTAPQPGWVDPDAAEASAPRGATFPKYVARALAPRDATFAPPFPR